MSTRVTVVGSLTMNLVVQVEQWPSLGDVVTGRGYHAIPGGKGMNQAVAAARQGAQVRMVGCVGQDEFGKTLLDTLHVNDIDTAAIRRASTATGVAIVALEPGGEGRTIVVPGANRTLNGEHIEQERSALLHSDWLLLQLDVPLEANHVAAMAAREVGSQVLLDIGSGLSPALPSELLGMASIVVSNEPSATELTGASTIPQAIEVLRARGVETFILTLGEQGCLIADKGGTRKIDAFAVDVVDMTAAGDAFVGALVVELARGGGVDEAVRFAAAAGALATTKVGGLPALPMRTAVEGLLALQEERTPAGYPEGLIKPLVSRAGEPILIRPILPTDAPRLQALFETLSPESIYRRFFSHRRELPLNEARALATVDYQSSLALVASLETEPDELIGVARFAPSAERGNAVEMAIVVADAFQHHGIGRALFQELVMAARERSFRWMLAETQSDNHPMIELAEHAGLPVAIEHVMELTRLWLDLQSPDVGDSVGRTQGGNNP